MENTQIKVQDMFGDMIGKDSKSPDQRTKLNNFSAKLL